MTILKKFLIVVIGSAFAFLVGCGGSSSPKTETTTPATPITTTGNNVVPITVNGGPITNFPYPDAAFTTVTVCVPGTTTCQTIDGVLVDTGSSGLRIPSDILTISLPQQMSGSNSVAECLQFLDSYSWGPVQTADIQIAGEKASSVPVQVLSDTAFQVPGACSSIGNDSDTAELLGANGILGVGMLAQDCGPSTCPASANMYYGCASSTSACQEINQGVAQQVQNPVAMFATDNNGVIVELPAVSGGVEASVSGSLVFGIGTQSNNGLENATVYTVDSSNLNFTTIFNGQTFSEGSFLDSGSNGYFFPDSLIPVCSDNAGFYCPSSTDNLSATNQGVSSGSGVVSFSVTNADTLFNDDPSDNGFGDLGGPASGYFDWGLPFFYGRNVYTAILGASTPGGTGPYWAY